MANKKQSAMRKVTRKKRATRTVARRESPTQKVAIQPRPVSAGMCSKWPGIRDTTSRILNAFTPFQAKQVNWRLNVSNTTDKLPVFIDWLATSKLKLSIQSGLDE